MNLNGSCIKIILSLYGFLGQSSDGFVDLLRMSDVNIPAEYNSSTCSPNLLPKMQDWIVRVTQDKFLLRASSKENRWNVQSSDWMKNNTENALSAFESMGLMESKYPEKGKYFECSAIFGSTAPYVKKAIQDLANRIENKDSRTSNVYMLTGDRSADIRDGGVKYIQKVAEQNNVEPHKVTETMLMEDIYDAVKNTSNNLPDLKVVREEKKKATTITTLQKFLSDLKENECNSILFVSRAPHIQQQYEDTNHVMRTHPNAKNREFDVMGSTVAWEEAGSKEGAVKFLSMAFASTLYGGFERVSSEISEQYLSMCPAPYEYLTDIKKPLGAFSAEEIQPSGCLQEKSICEA